MKKMKKMKNMKNILLLAMLVLGILSASNVYAGVNFEQENTVAVEARVKKGLKKENGGYYYYKNGKRIKNCWKYVWVKENGKKVVKKFYFGSTGKAYTYCKNVRGKMYVFNTRGHLKTASKARFASVGKYKYYIQADGSTSRGWQIIGGKLYYINKYGHVCRNQTYKGITFGSKGSANMDVNTRLKMECMRILSRITNSSMSNSQKLRACWNYVVGGNIYYSLWDPNIYETGWQRSCALQTLQSHSGSCYGFACAFAALAYEIGYEPYVLCGRVPGNRDGAADGFTRHGWVMIDGLTYDPEGQYAGWMQGVYGTYGYGIAHTIQQSVKF